VFEFAIHVVIVALIYGLSAISLNLQAGVAGLLNFGQVAFFGMGAYALAIAAKAGLPWPVGILAGMAVASLAGAGIGLLGRNLAAEYWAISTLALAEIVRLIALNEDWLSGGPQGLGGFPIPFDGVEGVRRGLAILGLCLFVLIASLGLAIYLTRSQFGRVLRLVRDQPALARSLGHDLMSLKLRMLMISAPIAAISGSLYAGYIGYIGPDQLLPFETFLVWTMIVIGGSGNHLGAVLGAVIVEFLYAGTPLIKEYVDISYDLAASLRILLVGAGLLAFLMLRTQGLIPERPARLDARG
jgi:branched-chain amino acid transport system permease protein